MTAAWQKKGQSYNMGTTHYTFLFIFKTHNEFMFVSIITQVSVTVIFPKIRHQQSVLSDNVWLSMVILALHFNKLGAKDDFLWKCKNSYSRNPCIVTGLEKVEMVIVNKSLLCFRSCGTYSRTVTYCRSLLILKKKQGKHDIVKMIIASSLEWPLCTP